jgi:ElaB/YqjD/DUF883 family membrane-anchored ribosome-binding protein
MNYQEQAEQAEQTRIQAGVEAATQAWNTTKTKAGEVKETGERYVRENPAGSVAGIFGLGVLVGVLVGWSLAHEERDPYAAATRRLMKRLNETLSLH